MKDETILKTAEASIPAGKRKERRGFRSKSEGGADWLRRGRRWGWGLVEGRGGKARREECNHASQVVGP
eukprot:scaffold12027_cov104-Isochrysis_galbana.AAC.3